jgi:hypothetical protein
MNENLQFATLVTGFVLALIAITYLVSLTQ